MFRSFLIDDWFKDIYNKNQSDFCDSEKDRRKEVMWEATDKTLWNYYPATARNKSIKFHLIKDGQLEARLSYASAKVIIDYC